MFKSHVYIEMGWGDDGYQRYLPPSHPHCAQRFFFPFFLFSISISSQNLLDSPSSSTFVFCVYADYSRQGLPYPPSGYAEMDNAVPPDRYGNFFFFFLFFHFFFYSQKFIKKKDMRKQTTATKRNRGHVYGGRGWPTRYGGIGCGNWSCRFSFPLALVFCLFMYTCDIVSSPQTKQQKRKGMEKDYKPLSPSSLSLRPEENFATVTNSGYDRWFCQVYS